MIPHTLTVPATNIVLTFGPDPFIQGPEHWALRFENGTTGSSLSIDRPERNILYTYLGDYEAETISFGVILTSDIVRARVRLSNGQEQNVPVTQNMFWLRHQRNAFIQEVTLEHRTGDTLSIEVAAS